MAEETKENQRTDSPAGAPAPTLHVAPGPHAQDASFTTQRMMRDVLIALTPILAVASVYFTWALWAQIGLCVGGCLAAEILFTWLRRRPLQVRDLSAVVTGVILALSLPGTCPWFVSLIASGVAIGIGKMIFGGLGFNLFNPAMVGRAFVMLSFAWALGATAYVPSDARSEASPAMWRGGSSDVISQATPMTAAYKEGKAFPLWRLLIGNTNGSLGETSALACLLGGLFLCWRRVASWRIPLGVILSAGVIAGILNLCDLDASWTALHHLLGGALLFGAFFIATDPVTSPITPKGKFIFGLGIGALVMLMRTLSAYPEGVMFAVLLMNAVTPLINRWTVPKPFGGPAPAKE
jgi:electron transport complex protein RnfD